MTVYTRPVRKTKKRFFNVAGAAEYIGNIKKETEIFGITKGQFSITDIIEHVLNQTGPAHVMISTWTAASADIGKQKEFLNNGKIQSLLFLVDRGFKNRQPEYCEEILKLFGESAIRFLRLHAKFIVIQNDDWNIVVRTSMNLNQNKRMENFEITEDKEFCEYFKKFFEVCFDSIPVGNDSGNVDQIDAFDQQSLLDIDFKL